LKRKDQESEGELFIGARLAARRLKAGITIDKAAKDTRIPVSRLREIEADDLSTFAHPTYARLFLIDYANYLRVPLEEIRAYLPGSAKLGSTDNQYLNVLLEKQGLLQGDQFKSIRRLLIGIGAGLAVLLLIALGIYSWKTWKKLERVQGPGFQAVAAKATPALQSVRPVALPKPSATPKPTATPTPSPSPTSTPFTVLPPFNPIPRQQPPQ
jgi:cytoskeletal protein RodZ